MLITGDTDPHTDIKIDDLTLEDNEDTVILFLNNNVGAYTKIGEEKIPAVAGTMVSFKGKSVVHHSVVPSGSDIRLLGPFSSRDLAAIGCMPVGSPVPCDGDDSKVVCTAEKGNGDKRCFCGSECTPLNVASCSGACGECTSFSGPAKEAVEHVFPSTGGQCDCLEASGCKQEGGICSEDEDCCTTATCDFRTRPFKCRQQFISDKRLKHDIRYIGKTPSEIPTYTFKYREEAMDLLTDNSVDAESTYFGTMAQDLLELAPDAVLKDSADGYYRVDYSKIDVDFYKI